MKDKDAIIFDLDGTLAISKSVIDEEMVRLLQSLLEKKTVLVISGGGWKQFKKQFLASLDLPPKSLSKLFISPGGGSALYRFIDGEIHEVYAHFLSKDEKDGIREAFADALPIVLGSDAREIHGELIEDRGTSMTFSGLGQDAPLELKEKWDPDHEIRSKIVALLKEKLPDLEIRMGGTTSIDITKKGEGKDFGIREFSRHLGIPIEKMAYVGDALYPGGNDEPAQATGIDCVRVKDVEETKKAIREIVSL